MPVSDFYELMLQEQIEPFGEAAEYLRAGISFDFEKGISANRAAPAQQSDYQTPEKIDQMMQVFAAMNPGKIRVIPKTGNA